jgi:nicotinic acid phosphoribosyltransferase
MKAQDGIKLVEVFAGELWQSTMVQNILEDNQINAFLENELMGTVAPWRVSSGGFNPVKVMVSNTDYDKAIKIIEEFNESEPVSDDE